jgi:GNAT superfamily N-acetyltransferase
LAGGLALSRPRINFREVEVFRPYPDEAPDDLFALAGLNDADCERCVTAQFVRIAKLDAEVIGAYAMEPESSARYCLLAIVVSESQRRRGLGRWLVGHAIGVAESKGARQVVVPYIHRREFFARIGFVPEGEGLRYDLIPE